MVKNNGKIKYDLYFKENLHVLIQNDVSDWYIVY
jgi:hypothetical protein